MTFSKWNMKTALLRTPTLIRPTMTFAIGAPGPLMIVSAEMADTWVVIHHNKRIGQVDNVYGPFDDWGKAYKFLCNMPAGQPAESTIRLVTGVG
jgi:hypothetical protein